jgi:hypothetical protein
VQKYGREKIPMSLGQFFFVYFQGKTEHILDDWKRFMESKQCDAANTPISNDLGQHPTEGSLAASFFSLDLNGGLVPKLGGFEVRTIAGLGFFEARFSMTPRDGTSKEFGCRLSASSMNVQKITKIANN